MKHDIKASLSVIIPIYNRADAIRETVTSLANQCLHPNLFEVILVDDGSTDNTVDLVEQLQSQLPYSTSLIKQKNRGPAAARNQGAQAATNDILLFWDSDMVAGVGTLKTHAELQQYAQRTMVAGAREEWRYTRTCNVKEVMRQTDPYKDQFSGDTPTFQHAFSCNMSVKRDSFWEIGGFDERLWAFEDLDLAYRAEKAGWNLIFSREAVGYHNHPMTFYEECEHQRRYQRYAVIFLDKHAELVNSIDYLVDKMPIRIDKDSPLLLLRKMTRQLLATRMMLKFLFGFVKFSENYVPSPKLLSFLYWKIIGSYQLIGFREGIKVHA